MTNKRDNIVVFDWNGTILSDTTACLRAMNVVLAQLGVRQISRADYQRHYTMPLDKLYHAIGVDPDVLVKRENEIHPLWHKTYDGAKIRLRRGARMALSHLSKIPCKSVILSNYVVERIDRQAKNFGVREHFSDIIAFQENFDTFRKKGKGIRLKDYLKDNPARAGIIVGDSEEEVEIGKENGLVTVAITDGMCSASRLRAMKPDYLIGSLDQIPKIASNVFLRSRMAS